MKQEKRGLVKPQKVDQDELVQGYCQQGYSNGPKSVACQSGYSCSASGISSVTEDFDLLT